MAERYQRVAPGSRAYRLQARALPPYIVKRERCGNPAHHAPLPIRIVTHHILPLAWGGKSEPANMVRICDNCHYGIHTFLDLSLEHGQLASQNGGKFIGEMTMLGWERRPTDRTLPRTLEAMP